MGFFGLFGFLYFYILKVITMLVFNLITIFIYISGVFGSLLFHHDTKINNPKLLSFILSVYFDL